MYIPTESYVKEVMLVQQVVGKPNIQLKRAKGRVWGLYAMAMFS